MKSSEYKVSKPIVDITWNLQRGRLLTWFLDSDKNHIISDGVFSSKIDHKILYKQKNIQPHSGLGYDRKWEQYKTVANRDISLYSPTCLVATVEMEYSSYPYVLTSAINIYDEVVLAFFPKPYIDMIWNLNTCSRLALGKGVSGYSVYLIFIEDNKCVGLLSPVCFSPLSNRFIAYHSHFKELVAKAYNVKISELDILMDDTNYVSVLR